VTISGRGSWKESGQNSKRLREKGFTIAQIGKSHSGNDSGCGGDWDHPIVWSRPRYPENAGNYYDDRIIKVDRVKQGISGYTSDW